MTQRSVNSYPDQKITVRNIHFLLTRLIYLFCHELKCNIKVLPDLSHLEKFNTQHNISDSDHISRLIIYFRKLIGISPVTFFSEDAGIH